jgi:hypothetical protein
MSPYERESDIEQQGTDAITDDESGCGGKDGGSV